jgi:RNA polymerase sigma-70 factor (ECF subfamily)
MKRVKKNDFGGTESPFGGQNNISESDDSLKIVPDDSDLLKSCRTGNMAALGQLIEKYQHRLFNAIFRVVGHHDDALELTQEAFVRAIKGLKNFRGQSGFYTWVFRIGINLAINHRQRNRHIAFTSLQPNEDAIGHQADGLAAMLESPDLLPQQQAELREEHQRVLQGLAEMDPAARAIIVLRDVEGLGYGEIAGILEIPSGTVKSRICRARKALREKLTKQEKLADPKGNG